MNKTKKVILSVGAVAIIAAIFIAIGINRAGDKLVADSKKATEEFTLVQDSNETVDINALYSFDDSANLVNADGEYINEDGDVVEFAINKKDVDIDKLEANLKAKVSNVEVDGSTEVVIDENSESELVDEPTASVDKVDQDDNTKPAQPTENPKEPVAENVKPTEKPVASKPAAENTKPAPVKPTEPAKPTPSPAKPTPAKPVPSKPAPSEPVVKWETNTWYTDVMHDTDTSYDGTLAKGTTTITQQGALGQDKHISNVKYVDGKRVDETYEVVRVKHPIEHRVVIGTYEKTVIPEGTTGLKSSPQITAMVNAINADRAKIGLNALKVKPELTNGAAIRSVELVTLFSHTRPNGQAFNTVAPAHAFGENIASASSDGLHTHGLFMNSPGHKANILDPDWNYIGISTYTQGSLSTQWTVLFGY